MVQIMQMMQSDVYLVNPAWSPDGARLVAGRRCHADEDGLWALSPGSEWFGAWRSWRQDMTFVTIGPR